MRFATLVDTSRGVAGVSGRLDKIERLAAFLRAVPPPELEPALAFLTGTPLQGRIGVGGAALQEAGAVAPAAAATLEIADVDAGFAAITAVSGPGSLAARSALLRALFARATAAEQEFLVRLLFGDLRQGALEGVLVEAVARAAGVPAATIRRAAMLSGSLVSIARTALVEGAAALAALVLRPFQPVQPMLADSAADIASALDAGGVSLEYKLDGARIQAHKSAGEVRVYSRSLRDVTAAVPEVVEAVSALPAREIVLDGEAIALRPDGSPHPFQVTMRRFGRKLDVAALRGSLPLAPFFFDCLYADGQILIDDPLARRVAVLDELVPPAVAVPRLITAARDEAEAFLGRALAAGHEGVMAKAVTEPYAAGRRGQAWLKVKPARTLDLVVLAVEWGSGRRRGMLSNLHLGARDAARGGFIMLGKTFKGLTDRMLAWQTQRLLELELAREGHVVFVRPELVVEIAFNDVQVSPHYPGRLALRFARVKRYRTDKTAAEADTIDQVRSIYRQMTGLEPPG